MPRDFSKEDFDDAIKIGIFHIEAGARSFSDWSAKMIEDMGEDIRPYLNEVWKGSQEVYKSFLLKENPEGAEQQNTPIEKGSERVSEFIKREILRGEKNLFIFRLFFFLAGYIGITLWLNAIRQNAALWFVWVLIIVQIFFYFSIFVACLMRAKQCGYRHAFWVFLALAVACRVNNWELMLIPAMVIIMLVLSWHNQKVSAERQHLLPKEDECD
jgi:hypothetical protein